MGIRANQPGAARVISAVWRSARQHGSTFGVQLNDSDCSDLFIIKQTALYQEIPDITLLLFLSQIPQPRSKVGTRLACNDSKCHGKKKASTWLT